MDQFLLGLVVMAAAIAGLVFLRFWRKTRDRLFVVFAIAFWLMSLHWALLALLQESEFEFTMYGLRLLAFLLILGGIIDKNRPGKRKTDRRSLPPAGGSSITRS